MGRRLLRTPTNPDAFGRILAAFRVYGGLRAPSGDKERQINDALLNADIDAAIVKRLVAKFDRTSKAARTRLLGPIAASDFVAPATVPSAAAIASTFGRVSVPDLPFAARRSSAETTTAANTTANAGPAAAHGGLVGERATEVSTGVESAPIYTIRYQGMFCASETDWDGASNSDEIYIISSAVHIAPDGSNVIRTERHPVDRSSYEDVDNREARLGPVAATWRGTQEVSLTVVVFEHDFGDPNKYRDEINTLVKGAIAILSKWYPPAIVLEALSETITDGLNWLLDTGDDLIETKTVLLPQSRMEEFAGISQSFYFHPRGNQPPQTTDLMNHFLTVHRGDGATYLCGFDILREPPLPINNVIL